jgi:hypothetical protein
LLAPGYLPCACPPPLILLRSAIPNISWRPGKIRVDPTQPRLHSPRDQLTKSRNSRSGAIGYFVDRSIQPFRHIFRRRTCLTWDLNHIFSRSVRTMSAGEPARNFSTSRDPDAQRASLCATVRHVNRAESSTGYRLNASGSRHGYGSASAAGIAGEPSPRWSSVGVTCLICI